MPCIGECYHLRNFVYRLLCGCCIPCSCNSHETQGVHPTKQSDQNKDPPLAEESCNTTQRRYAPTRGGELPKGSAVSPMKVIGKGAFGRVFSVNLNSGAKVAMMWILLHWYELIETPAPTCLCHDERACGAAAQWEHFAACYWVFSIYLRWDLYIYIRWNTSYHLRVNHIE